MGFVTIRWDLSSKLASVLPTFNPAMSQLVTTKCCEALGTLTGKVISFLHGVRCQGALKGIARKPCKYSQDMHARGSGGGLNLRGRRRGKEREGAEEVA